MRWSRWVGYWLVSAGLGCSSTPDIQILGESTRLSRAEPSPRVSAVFDGHVVRLVAARGETLGLSVRTTDGRRRSVRLELPGASVQGFEVKTLLVRRASTSMYGPSTGVGEYPDPLVPVGEAVSSTGLAYFDVNVAREASPGRREGALHVGELSLPVVLDVEAVSVDLKSNPLVWAFYLPKEIARVHGLPDGNGADLVDKEAEYHELLREHGVLLASDLGPERFPARRRFVRQTKYWPVAVDTSSDAAIRRDVRAWLDAFRSLSATPFTIPVDEPRSRAEKLRARHIADVIGQAGGGGPRLLRGVTDTNDPVYGDSIDVFLSPRNVSGARMWTYNGRPPQAGSVILDTDGVALRTWGWIAFRYHVELWYLWEALYYSDRYNHRGPTDVMTDPVTFFDGEDLGNGDGVLVYPGPLPSLRLKALRRGLTDRLLLTKLESCGGPARAIARRLVPRALGEGRGRRSWSTDERVWEQARREVLAAIREHCHGR